MNGPQASHKRTLSCLHSDTRCIKCKISLKKFQDTKKPQMNEKGRKHKKEEMPHRF